MQINLRNDIYYTKYNTQVQTKKKLIYKYATEQELPNQLYGKLPKNIIHNVNTIYFSLSVGGEWWLFD